MYCRQTSRRAPHVALLTEGVDRNLAGERQGKLALMSPSSRRAWIEIYVEHRPDRRFLVALLTEGVDRNDPVHFFDERKRGRPPHGGRG